jgi:hypothetical protein
LTQKGFFYKLMPVVGINLVTQDIASRSKSIFEDIKTGLATFTSKNDENQEPTSISDAAKIDTMMKCLNPHGRLDFTLHESLGEVSYISSIGVHMNYWSDRDCSAMIVRALYGIDHGVAN